MVFVGTVYALLGIVFALPASNARAWRVIGGTTMPVTSTTLYEQML